MFWAIFHGKFDNLFHLINQIVQTLNHMTDHFSVNLPQLQSSNKSKYLLASFSVRD